MYVQIVDLLQIPVVLAVVVALVTVLAAHLIETILARVVLALAQKTRTDLDDRVVNTLRRPIFYSVILIGFAWDISLLARGRAGTWHLSADTTLFLHNIFQTLAILIWMVAAARVGGLVLVTLSQRRAGSGLIQARTLPIFDITLKLSVMSLGIYCFLVAWKINASGWLASAGIVGIVIGLAAKDTLGNLFAGLFILADAPYKIGDYIVLDGGLRGRVTDIGIRSTRIQTRDDIEITVPNAVIGTSKIVNETAGPKQMRLGVSVSAAYGSDIDQVRKVLLSCPQGSAHVCSDPAPAVRFRSFGDSGLNFELLIWVDDPDSRGVVLDTLNSRVYKAFAAHNIEIPFPKRDIYIKQMPQAAQ